MKLKILTTSMLIGSFAILPQLVQARAACDFTENYSGQIASCCAWTPGSTDEDFAFCGRAPMAPPVQEPAPQETNWWDTNPFANFFGGNPAPEPQPQPQPARAACD